ncbi:hypothetical protein [Hymenobacter cellulosivorans]|uniref:Chloride channel protein n=1 Tax=Hymenobacter cellulosivorans TaxID=2932249 RepID=A0ABY4F6M0_9BACT|nr:hypothetical protein [Hymenobacter cellulosivorans]UOQ52183.1 hypothetical protein MUN80_20775 [Hymenobacter cellulosivorans]
MTEKSFSRLSLYCTALVTGAVWALLAWTHTHGGVPSHHFLAQKDLPAISNWWGGLLLPVLTWFLLSRIRKQAFGTNDADAAAPRTMRRQLAGFVGALLFGVVIAVLFTAGESDTAGNVMLGLFVVAFFVPIYRPECLLGFVLSMTYTFGAVLPTIIGTVLGLVGLVLHAYIRRALVYVGSQLMLRLPVSKPQSNG